MVCIYANLLISLLYPNHPFRVDDRWFEPDSEAERRRLEQLRQKQLAAAENNFTSERLFGRRFSGAACGVAEWRDDLKEAMRPESTEEENDEETTSGQWE